MTVTVPPETCRNPECGKQFVRTYDHRRYCSDECRIVVGKKKALDAALQAYWSDPEASRAKIKAWREAHPENQRAAARKSNSVTCVLCGGVRQRGDLTTEERTRFVCGACSGAIRRANRVETAKPTRPCWGCGNPTSSGGTKRPTCPDCFALNTILGEAIGVSRERARQLVNTYIKVSADMGIRLTRKQAAAFVRVSRSPLTNRVREVLS